MSITAGQVQFFEEQGYLTGLDVQREHLTRFWLHFV